MASPSDASIRPWPRINTLEVLSSWRQTTSISGIKWQAIICRAFRRNWMFCFALHPFLLSSPPSSLVMNNVCTLLEEHLHGMQRLEWRQCARWLPVWPGNSISERRASVWKGGGGRNGLRLRKKDGIDYRNRFSSGLIHAEFSLSSSLFLYFIFFFVFYFSYSDRFKGVFNILSFVTHFIRWKSHSRMKIYVNP